MKQISKRFITFCIICMIAAAPLFASGCGCSNDDINAAGTSSSTSSSSSSSSSSTQSSAASSSTTNGSDTSSSNQDGALDSYNGSEANGSSPLSAASQQESAPEPEAEESLISVSVTIDSSAAGNRSIGSYTRTVTLEEGSSAYDALIESGASPGGSSSYVSSINGLSEKECGPTSGWTYYVNGSFPSRAAGSYRLNDGDEVLWYYVTSYDDRP